MNDSITGLRPYRGIKPYNKRFQVAVTYGDFWGAVMAIACDLNDEQEDVNYGVRNISEGSFTVYKWWRSKIDPERINESTIISFSRIAYGSMLLQIEAKIYQRVGIRTAEEETAWRILREIGLRFPESRLNTPSSAPQPDDQAGEPPRSIYDAMPMYDKPRWPRSEWVKLFQYFESLGIENPDLQAIARKTGKPYEYVRKKSGQYGRGELDEGHNL